MRRVKPTFETVPSERDGRLGDARSELGSGDVVVGRLLMISSVPLSVVVLAESVRCRFLLKATTTTRHAPLAMPVAQYSRG